MLYIYTYHYSSTDEDPQHENFLEGETSWNKIKVDKHNVRHTSKTQYQMPGKRLFCLNLKNQQIRNFENVVKTTCHSPCWTKELQLSVNIRVWIFNSGMLWTYTKLFDECGLIMSRGLLFKLNGSYRNI